MPNIKTLDAPALTVQPTDIAASTARQAGTAENIYAREAGQAIGVGIARFGGQIGQAVDQANTMQWISHGAATYASLHNDLTQKWNDKASKTDPNDTSIAQGFREETLGPALDNFQQAFDGAPVRVQEWALQRSEQLRSDFERKVAADMSTRAGLAMHQNISTMERQYSNTAELDPTALPHIAESVRTDVDALIKSNPYITADQAARVKAELVPNTLKTIAQSAFIGMARANPDAAKQALDKGQFDDYFDAKDKQQATHLADGIKHAKLEDDNRAYELAKRQKTDTANTAHDDYVQQILSGKATSALRDMASDPRLAGFGHLKENLRNFSHELVVQSRDRTENVQHPQEVRSLIDSLHDTEMNDPNNLKNSPIYDAFTHNKLNKNEFSFVMSVYNNLGKQGERNFNLAVRGVERTVRDSIVGRMMTEVDPEWAANVTGQIERDAYAALNKERNKPDGDVNPLLDPTSPKYLFSKEKIQSYMPQPRQAARQAAGAAQTPSAPAASAAVPVADDFSNYIHPRPRVGGYNVEAPPSGRGSQSPLKALEGKVFASKEEATTAIRGAFGLKEGETMPGRKTLTMPVREFSSMADAEKAGLKPGTRIKVNGVSGTWQ